ncbi:MAG: 4-(cytidine 5'-diphospho)-2-C-methyl-D-erythritol kinase [Flavobacteriia bacterium]|nr:4-(cytidine 5'-diphospho)-2-C-methyl-D-erythritol kinase [Flavobacteriia bacterium]
MIQLSHCKINLGLHVKDRRDDGYHELESIFLPIPWNDIIEIVPSEKFSLISKGLFIPGEIEKNLCFKAYQLLKKKFQLPPVHIYLHKNIPMGAGLGGGSSNASTTLKILNLLFKLKLKKEELKNYALELGSDCPFFLENKAQLVQGRGEKMKTISINFKDLYIHLIYPGIHVSTKEAFDGLSPNNNRKFLPSFENLNQRNKWKDFFLNDFEKTIFPLYPELAIIKEKCYENSAFFASMSGSGSCLFAFYEKEPKKLFFDKTNYIEKIISLS